MWEVKVKVTITMMSTEYWEEDGETGESEVWSDEETAANLKVKVNHTGTDEQGEYLPDDEITADAVSEAVEEWKQMTGLQDNETTEIHYYYEPEKAKKVK